jgi:thiol:disulfide interchange protein DsbC
MSVCLLLPFVVMAADTSVDQLRATLAERLPEAKVEEIRPSPVAGVYEVVVDNRLYYISADGRHLLTGDVVDLQSRKNISTDKREKLVVRSIDAVGEANMVIMGPKKARRTVTVFTDVDCPYCAKFHLEVPALNKAGVRVRYLLFPRAGVGSESYKRSVAVWCAKDRAEAMGIAKAGGKLPLKSCANPVAQHYEVGQAIGVQGTPTLILDTGQIIPGYVPAAKLLDVLK